MPVKEDVENWVQELSKLQNLSEATRRNINEYAASLQEMEIQMKSTQGKNIFHDITKHPQQVSNPKTQKEKEAAQILPIKSQIYNSLLTLSLHSTYNEGAYVEQHLKMLKDKVDKFAPAKAKQLNVNETSKPSVNKQHGFFSKFTDTVTGFIKDIGKIQKYLSIQVETFTNKPGKK